MKKLLIGLFCLVAIFSLNIKNVNAANDKINVYVFTKDGCPYCEKLKAFLESIDKTHGKYFKIVEYQVYDSSWAADETYKTIMDKVAEKRGDTVEGVPYLVIGDSYSVNGYSTEYDDGIKEAIKKEYENDDYVDLVGDIAKEVLDSKDNEHSSDGLIVAGILVLVIGGCGALIYLSRKNK